MRPKIRIGILSNSNFLDWYMFDPLRRLIDENRIEVVFCCLNANSPKSSLFEKIPKIGRVFAESLFKLFSLSKSRQSCSPMESLNQDIVIRKVVTHSTKYSDRFSKGDIDFIKSMNVDFMIRNGFKILRGDILDVSRFGVLSFHHGDNLTNRGGPAFYWEFAEQWDNSGVVLQILEEELDGGRVVDRAFPQLVPWSYNHSYNCLFEASSTMMYKFLLNFQAKNIPSDLWHDKVYDRQLYKSASLVVGLSHAVSFLGRILIKLISKLAFTNKWSIFLGPVNAPFRKYKELRPPRGEFWADPFLLHTENYLYVYFEKLKRSSPIGRIGAIKLNKQMEILKQYDVDIGIESHLSFPNVFKHQNNIYMIPETASCGEIQLYRCVRFPDKFEKIKTLIYDVSAVDTTVIYYHGLWWLFTTHGTMYRNSKVELQIYYSHELISTSWTRHRKSPVIIDIRRARNAGQPFLKDGKIYRPAQDGTKRYGRRVALYEIVTLSEDEYEEKFVRYIEPNWLAGLNRCHTFNMNEEIVAVDASQDLLKANF